MTTFSTGKPRGEDSVPSILRLFIQILIHPQRRFGNPLRTFWAILCEPFSPKSRFFLDTPKFYTLYAGSPNVPPRVLAVWAKTPGPKPCGGNKQNVLLSHFNLRKAISTNLKTLLLGT